jgi:hypothetical protein
MSSLIQDVKKELANNTALEDIRKKLAEKGHKTEKIDKAINKAVESLTADKKVAKGSSGPYILKEIFDKVGYGFGSQQFVNILFFLTGASFFVIGIVNGIRVILSALISIFMEEYSKVRRVSKKFIGRSAIIFGFTFLLMSAAIFLSSPLLFALAILIGSVSIVPYGDFYQKLIGDRNIPYLKNMVGYGLIITAASLFIGAYLMDRFPIFGVPVSFTIFGKLVSLRVYGYIIVFEITALSFILSGYILSFIKGKEKSVKGDVLKQLRVGLRSIKEKLPYFFKNRLILMLIVGGVLTSVVQTIGNSYYGVFVYEKFKDVGFGGFLNVAMVFLVAVFSSFFGFIISKMDSKAYGKLPTMIFGTLLMALMPLSYYYRPNLVLITMGTIFGVIGSAIVGVTNGLVTLDAVHEGERRLYFSTYGLSIAGSYIVLVPFLAYFAQTLGLKMLFLILALVLILIVIPLYLITMIVSNKRI